MNNVPPYLAHLHVIILPIVMCNLFSIKRILLLLPLLSYYYKRMLGRLLDVKVWRGEGGGMSDHFFVEARLKLVGGCRSARRRVGSLCVEGE